MRAIETERTLLRRFEDNDLPAIIAILGNPQVMRFSLHGVRSREQCQSFLDSCLASYEADGYGIFAVVEKRTGEVIGYCGFYNQMLDGRREVEVAYRLVPRAWNKGVGTEILRRVLQFGFEDLGFPRLISNIEPENHASARVALKCGMVYDRDSIYQDTLPVRIYAIDRPHSLRPLPANSTGSR
jgi:[ribosomal protein S5]-alanine N-acetyltransferase